MKKMLIAANVLLLVIIFILLYCNCQKSCRSCDEKPQTGFCQSGECNTYTGGQMEGVLNFALARRMAEDYGNDDGKAYVWDGNRMLPKMSDSRSIWFDLKRIKQFIGYIESRLCKSGCYDTLKVGINMYYAKYPVNMSGYPELEGVPANYAQHHTLFMVPTFWNGVRNVDFDPGQVGANCDIKRIDTVVNSVPGRVYNAFYSMDSDNPDDVTNHGSLRPPPAGTGVFPEQ